MILLSCQRREWQSRVRQRSQDWFRHFPWLEVGSYGLGCRQCREAGLQGMWSKGRACATVTRLHYSHCHWTAPMQTSLKQSSLRSLRLCLRDALFCGMLAVQLTDLQCKGKRVNRTMTAARPFAMAAECLGSTRERICSL